MMKHEFKDHILRLNQWAFESSYSLKMYIEVLVLFEISLQ